MTLARSSYFFSLPFLAMACGGSTGSSTDAGTGAGGAGATGGTSGTGGAGASGGSGGATGGTGALAGAGGSAGASGECVTDADCAPGICGYPTSDACAAKGVCFPNPGSVCGAYSPGCACDGTETSLICMGLPNGYSPKPLAHAGACDEVDGGAPFACGEGLTCDSTAQYCKIATGGPCCPPPSYSCEAIPVQCQNDHSCACIQDAVNAQLCSESGGGVTVTFQYP